MKNERSNKLEWGTGLVPIVNNSKHPNPVYQTKGSAGMDLTANLNEPITIQPMDRVLIPTGLHISLPDGYEAQIRPRSGISIKRGITLINCIGTIDSDYTGEIKVAIINLDKNEQVINDGERIAQMVISKYQKISWVEVESLEETERGEGGFGSTDNPKQVTPN